MVVVSWVITAVSSWAQCRWSPLKEDEEKAPLSYPSLPTEARKQEHLLLTPSFTGERDWSQRPLTPWYFWPASHWLNITWCQKASAQKIAIRRHWHSQEGVPKGLKGTASICYNTYSNTVTYSNTSDRWGIRGPGRWPCSEGWSAGARDSNRAVWSQSLYT